MRNTTRENLSRLDQRQAIAINKVLRSTYKLLSDTTRQKIESLFHNSQFPESVDTAVRRNIAKEDLYLELLYQSIDKAFPDVGIDFHQAWMKTMQLSFSKESFPKYQEKYLTALIDENLSELPSGVLRYQILANMGEGVYLKNTSEAVVFRLRSQFTNEGASAKKSDDDIKRAIIATWDLLGAEVKTKLQYMAKEFGEESGEFYFDFVLGKMPLASDGHMAGLRPVWDWMKEHMKEEGKCQALFSKEFTIEALKAHRNHRIKQLSLRWKHRLSETAKKLVAALEAELGEKVDIPQAEFIRAEKLTRVEFEKREKTKWLPMLRMMSRQLTVKHQSLRI